MRQKGQKMAGQLFGLMPRKCAVCGKRFEAAIEYVYKTKKAKDTFHWFCSYHCFQNWKRAHKEKEAG